MERPVAAMIAGQWRDGMAPALRHFRMASVVTPVKVAAASAPPKRSISSAMEMDMETCYRIFYPASTCFVSAGNFFQRSLENEFA